MINLDELIRLYPELICYFVLFIGAVTAIILPILITSIALYFTVRLRLRYSQYPLSIFPEFVSTVPSQFGYSQYWLRTFLDFCLTVRLRLGYSQYSLSTFFDVYVTVRIRIGYRRYSCWLRFLNLISQFGYGSEKPILISVNLLQFYSTIRSTKSISQFPARSTTQVPDGSVRLVSGRSIRGIPGGLRSQVPDVPINLVSGGSINPIPSGMISHASDGPTSQAKECLVRI